MRPGPPRRRKSHPRTTTRGNLAVQAAILEAVDGQLRENSPPEVRLTLKRLVDSGMSDEMARLSIGMVLLFEMNDVLRTNAPFDEDRYVASLKRLPRFS